MNIFSMPKPHDQKQILPDNKLQRLAFSKGYHSAYEFGTAVSEAGITSYGTAFSKWNGRAGNTQYNTLLAIAKFLGASSIDEVFDP